MKDELFKQNPKKQFEFDASVASVFDDMIERSVPFYKENLELGVKILSKLLKKDARLCDLGCSSANFLLKFFELRKDVELSGVDNSKAMIELAKHKAKAFGAEIKFHERSLDLWEFEENDAFVANYTLQFIRPPKREDLLRQIYANLKENGVFLVSEKILYEESFLAKNMIEIYAEYKQTQGYSLFEIAAKREALENVLVPYTEKENIALLKKVGFKKIQILFKWANFESFLAFK